MRKGIIYMMIATLTFGVMNVFVKWLPEIPAIEIIFFRSIISLVLCVGMLKGQKVPLLGKNHKLLIVRGLSGAISLILYFYLLKKIPLASVVTMQYLTPIFTSLMGIWLVSESVRKRQWFFFTISFAGVLIVQGFDPRIEAIYLIMGIVCAFFMGVAYNVIRRLKTSEHPLVIMLYFPLITVPITGLYCLFFWVQPQGWDWLILLMVGLLTQVAQFFMTKAYQYGELSLISSINYLGIIYALGFGFVLFDETFEWIAYVGMALVLMGVLFNLWFKGLEQKKKTRQAAQN